VEWVAAADGKVAFGSETLAHDEDVRTAEVVMSRLLAGSDNQEKRAPSQKIESIDPDSSKRQLGSAAVQGGLSRGNVMWR
jgi:hypothetical protein